MLFIITPVYKITGFQNAMWTYDLIENIIQVINVFHESNEPTNKQTVMKT